MNREIDLFPLIEKGDVSVIRNLVEKQQQPVVVDKLNQQEDCTPLMYAACFGRLDVIKFLIEKGADINSQNNVSLSKTTKQ